MKLSANPLRCTRRLSAQKETKTPVTLTTRIAQTAFAVVITAGAALAADASATLPSIVDAAKRTHNEAREISSMLQVKNPDLDAVRGRVATLATHSNELDQLVRAAEAEMHSLSDPQKAELVRMQNLAKLVAVFVDNKQAILNADNAQKHRTLLRAKANGIAERAELLQRSALRLKG